MLHKLRDKYMKLDIIHEKKFFSNLDTKELFNKIKKESFQEQTFFDNSHSKMPRLIKWYGNIAYAYANIFHPALNMPDFLMPVLEQVNNYLIQKNISSQMNSVLMNYYRDGKDKINFHSDDLSQIGQQPVICSVSLGTTRKFIFKHKITKERIEIELNDGDLLIMLGTTQEDWLHGVLPEENKDERINLTFRNTLYQPIMYKANL